MHTRIVVPCYQERERLEPDSFARFVDAHADVGLVFVDDGSRDGTAEVLDELARRLPGTLVVHLEQNGGKAEAVRAGVLRACEAGCERFGYVDADLAAPLEAILDLAAVLDAHPETEAVFGSRVRMLGYAIERSPVRHYVGRVFATFASEMLRVPVYDTQCGVKLFRCSCRDLFTEPFHANWAFDVEIVARLRARVGGDGAAVEGVLREQPLRSWHEVPGSKVRPADALRAMAELWTIWRRYRR